MNHVLSVVFVVVACVPLYSQEAVQKDDSNAEQELVKQWYAVYDQIGDSFNVTISDDVNSSSLEKPKRLLTYSSIQTGRNLRTGRIYLWTNRGKPIVIGAVFSKTTLVGPQMVSYEFHSLSQQPVGVHVGERLVWEYDRPGIAWIRHTPSLKPASRRAARLVQMRAIARSYTPRYFQRDSRTSKGRSIPQPIYRNPDNVAGLSDGAIFAYTSNTTDPDTFLFVSASETSWQVAFARSNIVQMQVETGGKVVWSADRAALPTFNKPFFIQYNAEFRSADRPESILRRIYVP